ncbi:hypothetical protein [Leptolyngbya sp. FACHB-711]|nr:hypothetical protein [Leptolyngbya sp. FACHB-711]
MARDGMVDLTVYLTEAGLCLLVAVLYRSCRRCDVCDTRHATAD